VTRGSSLCGRETPWVSVNASLSFVFSKARVSISSSCPQHINDEFNCLSTGSFIKLCALHKSPSHYSASWNSHFSAHLFHPTLSCLLILLSFGSVGLRPVMSPTVGPLNNRLVCSGAGHSTRQTAVFRCHLVRHESDLNY